MPKLKEDHYAVPDGEIYPKMFLAGEEVTGQVAESAKQAGRLQATKAGRKAKAAKAPENK